VVLVLFIIYLIVRAQVRASRRVLALRNRISRDLHDEIGSTLSSIGLFATVAQHSLSEEKSRPYQLLSRINAYTTQTIESINDIVWTIKAENDAMVHMVNRMQIVASELMDTEKWRVEIHCQPDLLQKNLDMIERRNVYMIFKEAVNNAVKYSGGNSIMIRIYGKARMVMMEVADNGNGMAEKENGDMANTFGGNGIGNMKRRAEELGGILKIESDASGTRVMLQFHPGKGVKTH
jgi:signal transduction histidine kinase